MRDQVVMLSEGLWKRRYGADPAIIGKSIQRAPAPTPVVGVMPAGFRGAFRISRSCGVPS